MGNLASRDPILKFDAGKKNNKSIWIVLIWCEIGLDFLKSTKLLKPDSNYARRTADCGHLHRINLMLIQENFIFYPWYTWNQISGIIYFTKPNYCRRNPTIHLLPLARSCVNPQDLVSITSWVSLVELGSSICQHELLRGQCLVYALQAALKVKN